MLSGGPSGSSGELVVLSWMVGGPKGGGHIGEEIFRARLSLQWRTRVDTILKNGRHTQKNMPRVIRRQVIKERGSLDLGAVSTESTLKILGPQSWNSTFSLSCMLEGEGLLAWFTRALIPSAPRESAPPIAIYLPAPLIVFDIFSLIDPLG